MPWPSDGDIQPSFISQKADAALKSRGEVRANAVENDDILLSSLESIHSVDLDGCLELTVLASTQWAQTVLQMTNLRLIWSNDSNTASDGLQSPSLGAIESNELNQLFCKFSFIHVASRSIISCLP